MSRTRRELALLSERDVQRFAVESLVVLLGVLGLFRWVAAPLLRSIAPGLFPAPVRSVGRGFPATRLAWAQLLTVLVVFGGFFYWRLYHTALGESVVETTLSVVAAERTDDPVDR